MRKYKVTITLVSYEYAENANHARHIIKQRRKSLYLENKDIKVETINDKRTTRWRAG
jgi:hypothetical protein